MFDWLFFVLFTPLILASLFLCGDDSSLRSWRSMNFKLDRDERREFGRFLRSNESRPPPSIEPAVSSWAEGVIRQQQCRWDRYLNWAWVLWITAGLVTAIAFGTVRDVAIHLVVFDLMLMAVVGYQYSRRRARIVLMRRG